MEVVRGAVSFTGGDDGGVSSRLGESEPGGHTGMCLFGTAAGVPREEVFKVRCGGGVEERVGIASVRATTAAMTAAGLLDNGGVGRRHGWQRVRCRCSSGVGGARETREVGNLGKSQAAVDGAEKSEDARLPRSVEVPKEQSRAQES